MKVDSDKDQKFGNLEVIFFDFALYTNFLGLLHRVTRKPTTTFFTLPVNLTID